MGVLHLLTQGTTEPLFACAVPNMQYFCPALRWARQGKLCPVPAPLARMTLQSFPTSLRLSGGPENWGKKDKSPPQAALLREQQLPANPSKLPASSGPLLSFQLCVAAILWAQHPSRGFSRSPKRCPFRSRRSAHPAAPALLPAWFGHPPAGGPPPYSPRETRSRLTTTVSLWPGLRGFGVFCCFFLTFS